MTIPLRSLFNLTAAALLTAAIALPQAQELTRCNELPTHAQVRNALQTIVAQDNAGLGFHMWATLVSRDGVVCVVAFSGADRGAQWPGSRVISAQKANTANAFSLDGLALSTANLYSAVQPGGSLFGLQESNPVDTGAAYGGNALNFGQSNDPMRGRRIGGVNVFGGGLALYNSAGHVVGALGVSGDTSCTDHIIAWKLRDALKLDHVPGGVSPTSDDNIVFDGNVDPSTGHLVSAGGWGHPQCDTSGVAKMIAEELPTSHPIGTNP